MYSVILANKSLGISMGSVVVCGHSRKHLGYSRYSDQYRCHVLEMTPEQYEAAAEDLSRNWHRSRCKWVPHFVNVVEEPAKVIEPKDNPQLRELMLASARKLSREDIQMLADEAGVLLVDKDPARGTTITMETLAEDFHKSSLGLPNHYWPLLKICKSEGVPLDNVKGIVAMQQAILNHRQKAA